MKLYKLSLRMIIGVSSLAGFLGGWAMLAHAPKPVAANAQPAIQTTAPVVIPTLEAIPSLENRSSGLQPLPSLPRSNFAARPRLRTGGS
jgi:hypothetical protein